MDHTIADGWQTDVASVSRIEERAQVWRESYIPRKRTVADLYSDDAGRREEIRGLIEIASAH